MDFTPWKEIKNFKIFKIVFEQIHTERRQIQSFYIFFPWRVKFSKTANSNSISIIQLFTPSDI